MTSRAKSRLLFIALILLEALVSVLLVEGRRLPDGHDGFGYIGLQYYFLDNSATGGGIAKWIPYMTHGTVSTWWYAIQGGLLQNLLIEIAPIAVHGNLIPYLHAGMLLESWLLLTGVWLLSSRFCATVEGRFAVTLFVLCGAIWIDQPWYDFGLYFALPLVCAFGHKFLETGRWRYALLAGNLLAFQTVGNLPYFIPAASFWVFSYFVIHALLHWKVVYSQMRDIKVGFHACCVLLLIALSFVCAYAVLEPGTADIVNYNLGRNLDGSTTLHGYLTYAFNQNLNKWIECLIGVPACLEYTLYSDILCLPLAISALLARSRAAIHWAILGGIFLLIASATPLATVLYYAWPGMKYYRHLALLCPLVRVSLCFMAGVGFEALFYPPADESRAKAGKRWALSLVMLGLAVSLPWLLFHPKIASKILSIMVNTKGLPSNPISLNPALWRPRLILTGSFALGWSLVIAAATMPFRGRARKFLWLLSLLLLAAETYTFKISYVLARSMKLSASDATTLMAVQPLPLVRRRSPDPLINPNARTIAVLHSTTFDPLRHWSTNAFLFTDEVGHQERTDHWLKPFDELMKALGKSDIDFESPPKGWKPATRLVFPDALPASGLIIGRDTDKIQFFSSAQLANTDREAAGIIANPMFSGNYLILEESGSVDRQPLASPTLRSDLPFSANSRAQADWNEIRFDANAFSASVDNRTGAPLWMLYCDVWNAGWHATVNGQPAPLYRADLAYKAVLLGVGKSDVIFRYSSPVMDLLAICFAVQSVLWLGVLAVLIIGELRPASIRP